MAHAILRHFRFDHLPPHLQATSKPFCDLAHWIARELPENDESREAMRKLLEAKDCGVRALLEASPPSSRAPASLPSIGDPP
jgi:hypothetical protein